MIANKGVDRVIELLARDPGLAAATHYTVAGPLDESDHTRSLHALTAAHPSVHVELLGWCEPERLDAIVAATDVFINLRHPVFESGSASLARQLAAGRPILCFDEGSFGELPPDAVARVPVGDHEAAGRELARLVADPARRTALGRAAHRVACERGEAAYARALLAFLPEVVRAAPALALLDRVGDELAAIRAAPGLPVHEAVRAALAPLLP